MSPPSSSQTISAPSKHNRTISQVELPPQAEVGRSTKLLRREKDCGAAAWLAQRPVRSLPLGTGNALATGPDDSPTRKGTAHPNSEIDESDTDTQHGDYGACLRGGQDDQAGDCAEDEEAKRWMHLIDDIRPQSATPTSPLQTDERGNDEEEKGEGEEGRERLDGSEKESTSPASWTHERMPMVGSRRTRSSSTRDSPRQRGGGEATLEEVDATTNAFPDPLADDEGYCDSERESCTTSVDWAVHQWSREDGRDYPTYGRHEYGLPVDEREQDRMDIQHEKYFWMLDGELFLAPIGDDPQNILDLGTGTGRWAIAVADQFPSARVRGVDVAAIQPTWVPPNCEFEIVDVEAGWDMRRESFDLVHMREPFLVVRQWQHLIGQCFDHLRPGGWCELSCTDWTPQSDDGRMPDHSQFGRVCEKLVEASHAFGTPADCPRGFADHLARAGFVHVTTRVFQIPSCPWPEDDERQMEIGRLEQENLLTGASSFGLRVFQRAFGWSWARTEMAMREFRRDLANSEYRQYLRQ